MQGTLTDDFASGAAGVDEPLSSAELWRETAADEGVQNAVTTVGHHRGVARQLVSLQGWGGKRTQYFQKLTPSRKSYFESVWFNLLIDT